MKPIYDQSGVTLFHGDALTVLRELPSESVHCCITSPPYWGLRDYGTGEWVGGDVECKHKQELPRFNGPKQTQAQVSGHASKAESHGRRECQLCGVGRVDEQIGLEPTMDEYLQRVVNALREVRRVLREDGTLWVNMGDSYCSDAGTDRKPSTLAGQRVPAGWTNRSQPTRIHAARKNKDCDPKRGVAANGQPLGPVHDPQLKPKDLALMPARLAIALQDDGWWVRADIIWHKPNPMPESVSDRPTKAHEYIYLLSKSANYFYDADAIKEPAALDTHARYARGRSNNHEWADGGPGNQTIAKSFEYMRKPGVNPKAAQNSAGSRQNASFSAAVVDVVEDRNKRSVWTVPTYPFPEAHFATFPPALILPCVLAGCPVGGTILDPFFGAGTTGLVAKENGRKCIGIELSEPYCAISVRRLRQEVFDFQMEAGCRE